MVPLGRRQVGAQPDGLAAAYDDDVDRDSCEAAAGILNQQQQQQQRAHHDLLLSPLSLKEETWIFGHVRVFLLT